VRKVRCPCGEVQTYAPGMESVLRSHTADKHPDWKPSEDDSERWSQERALRCECWFRVTGPDTGELCRQVFEHGQREHAGEFWPDFDSFRHMFVGNFGKYGAYEMTAVFSVRRPEDMSD
jgi:hypothetical protein